MRSKVSSRSSQSLPVETIQCGCHGCGRKGPGSGEKELGSALHRLREKLPADVTSLVAAHQRTAAGSHVGPFDENPLEKALQIWIQIAEEA